MTFSNRGRRRGAVRVSVLGALALIAALVFAALLASRTGAPIPGEGTESPSRDPPEEPAPLAQSPLDAAAGSDRASTPSPADASESRSAGPAQPKAKFRFKVAVSPLVLETTDRASALAFGSIYAALLDELRSSPNLELFELGGADRDLASRPVDFEIRVKGESRIGPTPVPLLHVSWSATRGGTGNWTASLDPSLPWTAEAIARETAEALRRFPFPPEISRSVELEAAVLDTHRSSEERFGALSELQTIPQRFAFVGRDERRVVAVAAADIVANSADPEVRSRVWRAMRKLDDPYLIGPLVDSLLNDDDEHVRLEAVRSLGSTFGRDPKAVAALEYALVHDFSPLVRANVRWELLDDDARREYFAGTLLRDDLSDAARLELVTEGVSGFRRYIDRRAVQALVDIASRALPSTQKPAPEENTGRVSAAEIVPLLLDVLTDDASAENRAAAAAALVRHRGETGVREALERAARDDPSPQVRNQISRALLRLRYGLP